MRPPKYALATPRIAPSVAPSTEAPKPTISAVRERKSSRESTSRPNESVPSQCASVGRASIAPKSTASGSYGASTGANSATTNITMMTAPPTAPSGRAAQNSRAARSQRLSAPGGAASTASGTGTGTRATAMDYTYRRGRGAPRLRRGASERWGVWGAISGPPTTIDEPAADRPADRGHLPAGPRCAADPRAAAPPPRGGAALGRPPREPGHLRGIGAAVDA